MATVPNWIAKAVIHESLGYGRWADIIDTISWRPTKTQVVVTVQTARGQAERRFRLSDLREVGGSPWASTRATLMDPDDPKVATALRERQIRRAVDRVKVARDVRLDASAMSVEELAAAVDRIQRAATKSLAELGELL